MVAQPPFLGPTCPDCGAPLRSAAAGCRHCGFSPHAPQSPDGLMTSFGYGFCGFGTGLLLAMVLGLSDTALPVGRGPVAGLLLCLVAARSASWVGIRLAPEWRCSYEHLLISLLIGGVATLVGAVAAPLPLGTCGLLWLTAAALSYALLARYGYRRRDY